MTILHIDSSISGENSASRAVSASIVEQLKSAQWGEPVVYRDLASDPLSHLTLDAFADTSVLDEFLAADTVVIGAPMYNFGVATSLRAWFDHVLRAGETFSYSAEGPKGLMTNKRVIVIESRGGLYSEGPAAAIDFQEPYLRHLLGFMGITDVTFVHAEKIGYGPEARAAALVKARAQIEALAGAGLAQAA